MNFIAPLIAVIWTLVVIGLGILTSSLFTRAGRWDISGGEEVLCGVGGCIAAMTTLVMLVISFPLLGIAMGIVGK